MTYAWPVEAGASGRRAFVIDESGEVFVTENEKQGYSGLAGRPAGDAAYLSANNNRNRGIRSVRRGRDGGLWLKEDL